jgi:hypothetical protein
LIVAKGAKDKARLVSVIIIPNFIIKLSPPSHAFGVLLNTKTLQQYFILLDLSQDSVPCNHDAIKRERSLATLFTLVDFLDSISAWRL